ncbi:MAG: hypothetical protein B7Z27_08320, partial [Sphingobacteriia bacterium 32-37-4]
NRVIEVLPEPEGAAIMMILRLSAIIQQCFLQINIYLFITTIICYSQYNSRNLQWIVNLL